MTESKNNLLTNNEIEYEKNYKDFILMKDYFSEMFDF